MMISPVLDFINNSTLYLLFAGLGIFIWLAWRSHSIKSFQFQISMFLLIWIVGEFVTTLHEIGLFNFPYEFHDLGMQIHLVSMILFASIIFVRFYYSHRAGHKIIESLDAILK
jgi:sterol desaturase/sphingolipid hydroxylase (fatty acid hydroxylase superfamily)